MSYEHLTPNPEVAPPTFTSLETLDGRHEDESLDDLTDIGRAWVAYYGGEGELFSKEQEQYLATTIQTGLAAQAQLQASMESGRKISVQQRAALRSHAQEGQTAQRAMVETNLRFAYMFAAASMGIQNKKILMQRKEDDFRNTQGGFAPGTYRALLHSKSIYAEYDDRKQNAVLGLIDAAAAFKPGSNAKFITFASWRIQQSIERNGVKSENNGIRHPVAIHEKVLAYFGNNQTVSPDHVVPDGIGRLLRMHEYVSIGTVSMVDGSHVEYDDDPEQDKPKSFDEQIAEHYAVTDDVEAQFELEELGSMLQSVLSTLSEREETVIRMRSGLNQTNRSYTLDEIGQVVGVTRERIRQIESKAMSKLRHPDRSIMIKDYERWSPADLRYPSGWSGDDFVTGQSVAYRTESLRAEPAIETFVPEVSPPSTRERHELRSWQAYAADPWELSERTETSYKPYEIDAEARQNLRDMFDKLPVYHFQRAYVESINTPYPASIVKRVEALRGDKQLPAQFVVELWDHFLSSRYRELQEQAHDFMPDRVGQLFSKLICDTISSDESVKLVIPEHAGRIGHLATHLKHGTVTIKGNAGDYVGSYNKGTAVVTADMVGDYAGAAMGGYATLFVKGRAGNQLGDRAGGEAVIYTHGADSVAENIGEQVMVEADLDSGKAN